MQSGHVSRIVVWRLDRLGRTASGLTTLFDELQQRKVGLTSIRDGVDLTTAAGRMMAGVLASVASYENEVRSERIVAGQAAARSQGKQWGGSKRGRHIAINDEQIATILRLHKESGKSGQVAAIARATGLNRPSVYAVLTERNGSASDR
jgi:DNA invertase Pin-like site-specific DNA recombinase